MRGTDPAAHAFPELIGFPPGRRFILLPRTPVRAALGGLALYDGTELHQRLVLRAGRALLRCGLGRIAPASNSLGWPEPEWLRTWVRECAEPVVGPVSGVALRPVKHPPNPPPRVAALLFDREGRGMCFAKLTWPGEPESFTDAVIPAVRRLGAHRSDVFSVPRLLASGTHDSCVYLLQEVLPQGVHRRLPDDPDRVAAIVDAIQQRLGFLSRTTDIPHHFVPVHGSLTPLNLRVGADGDTWLLDWDRAGFGPPLTDELHYWISDLARRPGALRRKVARLTARLYARGTESQIAEAMRWRESIRPSENSRAEQRIRSGLGGLARDA